MSFDFTSLSPDDVRNLADPPAEYAEVRPIFSALLLQLTATGKAT